MSDLPPLAPLTLPCAGTGVDQITLSLGFTGDHVEIMAVCDGRLAPVPISMPDVARAADWLTRATMRRAK